MELETTLSPSERELRDDLAREERFKTSEQKVLDLKYQAKRQARLNNWLEEFRSFTGARINIEGQGIDLAEERKYRYLTDDLTNFRIYFTIPFVVRELSKNLTAHTIAHYASINVHDVYACLDRLAREGFLEKKKLIELPKYKELKSKQEAVTKQTRLLDRDKKCGLKQASKQYAEANEDLESWVKEYEFSAGHLGMTYEESALLQKKQEKLEEIENHYKTETARIEGTYEKKKADIALSKEEERLLGPAKPKSFYTLAPKGGKLLEDITKMHSPAYEKFAEIFRETRGKLDALNLFEPAFSSLDIVHIPEDRLEQSYRVFLDYFNAHELPASTKPLFDLYRRLFRLGDSEQKLTCIGQGAPFARICLGLGDRLYAVHENQVLPIGELSVDRKELLDLLATKDAQQRLDSLNIAIRHCQIDFAKSLDEIENCRKLGIYYENSGVRTFYTSGNVESLKFYASKDSISLENFAGLVFLPRTFDRQGIKYAGK
jgi:hypothetical protein